MKTSFQSLVYQKTVEWGIFRWFIRRRLTWSDLRQQQWSRCVPRLTTIRWTGPFLSSIFAPSAGKNREFLFCLFKGTTNQDLSNDTTFSQIKSRVPIPLICKNDLRVNNKKGIKYVTVGIIICMQLFTLHSRKTWIWNVSKSGFYPGYVCKVA